MSPETRPWTVGSFLDGPANPNPQVPNPNTVTAERDAQIQQTISLYKSLIPPLINESVRGCSGSPGGGETKLRAARFLSELSHSVLGTEVVVTIFSSPEPFLQPAESLAAAELLLLLNVLIDSLRTPQLFEPKNRRGGREQIKDEAGTTGGGGGGGAGGGGRETVQDSESQRGDKAKIRWKTAAAAARTLAQNLLMIFVTNGDIAQFSEARANFPQGLTADRSSPVWSSPTFTALCTQLVLPSGAMETLTSQTAPTSECVSRLLCPTVFVTKMAQLTAELFLWFPEGLLTPSLFKELPPKLCQHGIVKVVCDARLTALLQLITQECALELAGCDSANFSQTKSDVNLAHIARAGGAVGGAGEGSGGFTMGTSGAGSSSSRLSAWEAGRISSTQRLEFATQILALFNLSLERTKTDLATLQALMPQLPSESSPVSFSASESESAQKRLQERGTSEIILGKHCEAFMALAQAFLPVAFKLCPEKIGNLSWSLFTAPLLLSQSYVSNVAHQALIECVQALLTRRNKQPIFLTINGEEQVQVITTLLSWIEQLFVSNHPLLKSSTNQAYGSGHPPGANTPSSSLFSMSSPQVLLGQSPITSVSQSGSASPDWEDIEDEEDFIALTTLLSLLSELLGVWVGSVNAEKALNDPAQFLAFTGRLLAVIAHALAHPSTVPATYAASLTASLLDFAPDAVLQSKEIAGVYKLFFLRLLRYGDPAVIAENPLLPAAFLNAELCRAIIECCSCLPLHTRVHTHAQGGLSKKLAQNGYWCHLVREYGEQDNQIFEDTPNTPFVSRLATLRRQFLQHVMAVAQRRSNAWQWFLQSIYQVVDTIFETDGYRQDLFGWKFEAPKFQSSDGSQRPSDEWDIFRVHFKLRGFLSASYTFFDGLCFFLENLDSEYANRIALQGTLKSGAAAADDVKAVKLGFLQAVSSKLLDTGVTFLQRDVLLLNEDKLEFSAGLDVHRIPHHWCLLELRLLDVWPAIGACFDTEKRRRLAKELLKRSVFYGAPDWPLRLLGAGSPAAISAGTVDDATSVTNSGAGQPLDRFAFAPGQTPAAGDRDGGVPIKLPPGVSDEDCCYLLRRKAAKCLHQMYERLLHSLALNENTFSTQTQTASASACTSTSDKASWQEITTEMRPIMEVLGKRIQSGTLSEPERHFVTETVLAMASATGQLEAQQIAFQALGLQLASEISLFVKTFCADLPTFRHLIFSHGSSSQPSISTPISTSNSAANATEGVADVTLSTRRKFIRNLGTIETVLSALAIPSSFTASVRGGFLVPSPETASVPSPHTSDAPRMPELEGLADKSAYELRTAGGALLQGLLPDVLRLTELYFNLLRQVATASPASAEELAAVTFERAAIAALTQEELHDLTQNQKLDFNAILSDRNDTLIHHLLPTSDGDNWKSDGGSGKGVLQRLSNVQRHLLHLTQTLPRLMSVMIKSLTSLALYARGPFAPFTPAQLLPLFTQLVTLLQTHMDYLPPLVKTHFFRHVLFNGLLHVFSSAGLPQSEMLEDWKTPVLVDPYCFFNPDKFSVHFHIQILRMIATQMPDICHSIMLDYAHAYSLKKLYLLSPTQAMDSGQAGQAGQAGYSDQVARLSNQVAKLGAPLRSLSWQKKIQHLTQLAHTIVLGLIHLFSSSEVAVEKIIDSVNDEASASASEAELSSASPPSASLPNRLILWQRVQLHASLKKTLFLHYSEDLKPFLQLCNFFTLTPHPDVIVNAHKALRTFCKTASRRVLPTLYFSIASPTPKTRTPTPSHTLTHMPTHPQAQLTAEEAANVARKYALTVGSILKDLLKQTLTSGVTLPIIDLHFALSESDTHTHTHTHTHTQMSASGETTNDMLLPEVRWHLTGQLVSSPLGPYIKVALLPASDSGPRTIKIAPHSKASEQHFSNQVTGTIYDILTALVTIYRAKINIACFRRRAFAPETPDEHILYHLSQEENFRACLALFSETSARAPLDEAAIQDIVSAFVCAKNAPSRPLVAASAAAQKSFGANKQTPSATAVKEEIEGFLIANVEAHYNATISSSDRGRDTTIDHPSSLPPLIRAIFNQTSAAPEAQAQALALPPSPPLWLSPW